MSIITKRILCSVATLALAASLHAASKTVTLTDAKGQTVGTATLSEGKAGSGVTIKLNVKNLTPGEHALHFHATAKCEPPGFTTAGGHFNPGAAHHGIKNPENPHPHAGDMANFMVSAKGTAKVTIKNMNVTMGSGANTVLGTALMIHAKADDLKSDPSGNAGDRVACGLVTK